jgi:Carboxypeptidase regulatory-like domain
MRLSKTVFATVLIGTMLQSQAARAQLTAGLKVSGFVRDSAMNPLQGDVTVVQGTTRRVVRNIRTTSNGYYEAVLAPGPAMLIAKAPGFSSETHNVAGNQNRQYDFSLRKPITVDGQVIAPGGVPIIDARVRVRYPDSPTLFQFAQEVGDVITDSQGRFELPFVRAFSRFVLEVEATGYQLRHSRDFISKDQPMTVSVELQRGAAIRGQIVDDNGSPVANAFVTLRILGNGSRGSLPAAVLNSTTSASGEFSFTGLATGSYAIVVRKEGFKPQWQPLDLRSSADDHWQELTLTR